jgi:prepilin-type N-terminal cleavage/methylation domain-containing protein
MTSRTKLGGFTLLEVMAAVLVLGLLYTVLAGAAMRGLRSEGVDRRRAGAEMIADRKITEIESDLESGAPLEDGLEEGEVDSYKVSSNVEPFDVLTRLPGPLSAEIAQRTDPKAPSLLHDERGKSRIRLVSVVVEWDEAGEPATVERNTFAYDRAAAEQLLPSTAASGGTDDEGGNPASEIEKVRKLASPELRKEMGGIGNGSGLGGGKSGPRQHPRGPSR